MCRSNRLPATRRAACGHRLPGWWCFVKIIYFVQDTGGGEIKVGVARKRQLQKRIGKLQLGNPSELKLLGVIPARNAGELQRELHTTFSDAHIRGEWFRSTPDLLAYIRQRAVMP